MSLKTENSRRVAESRPVCLGLNISSAKFSSFNGNLAHAQQISQLLKK
jgi:hypothetical protein